MYFIGPEKTRINRDPTVSSDLFCSAVRVSAARWEGRELILAEAVFLKSHAYRHNRDGRDSRNDRM